MARIRTIKPDFWTDEKIVELSMEERLFFIGSWNFADDNGNLQRSAKKLKMQIFPADSIDCEPLIQSLINHGMLIEYSVDGEIYLHIKGFRKHQVINRPSKSGLPIPEKRESSSTAHGALIDGREGKGKEKEGNKNPPNPPAGGCVGTFTEKKAKVKAERMTLKTFLDRCHANGEKPISDYEPLTRYMAESGLPPEFVNLCWQVFKRDFSPGGKSERKQQARWRQHFQNFVEGNFNRLWYAKPQGDGVVYELTTVGLQAQTALQRREAA